MERFLPVEDIIQGLHADGIEPTADAVKDFIECMLGRSVQLAEIEIYLDAYAYEPDTCIDLAAL